jgi:hypothetical protein
VGRSAARSALHPLSHHVSKLPDIFLWLSATASGSSAREDRIPGCDDGAGLQVLRRRQHLRNYSLPTPDALEQLVHVVQRFTGKVNLGHEPVRAAGHVEMDVRWSGPSLNAGWISTRFDCLEPEPPFCIRALAAELARLQPTVIFANNPGALHVKAATTTIPIVFTAGFDPIELGLVTNLKQPGGNITGVSILNVELGPKRLEFLHELVLGAVMALLVNPVSRATLLPQDAVGRGTRAGGVRPRARQGRGLEAHRPPQARDRALSEPGRAGPCETTIAAPSPG